MSAHAFHKGDIMTANEYLKFIAEQIHSTVVATVDSEGLPVTCVIDMMRMKTDCTFSPQRERTFIRD